MYEQGNIEEELLYYYHYELKTCFNIVASRLIKATNLNGFKCGREELVAINQLAQERITAAIDIY